MLILRPSGCLASNRASSLNRRHHIPDCRDHRSRPVLMEIVEEDEDSCANDEAPEPFLHGSSRRASMTRRLAGESHGAAPITFRAIRPCRSMRKLSGTAMV